MLIRPAFVNVKNFLSTLDHLGTLRVLLTALDLHFLDSNIALCVWLTTKGGHNLLLTQACTSTRVRSIALLE